jgi:hypothetical protein
MNCLPDLHARSDRCKVISGTGSGPRTSGNQFAVDSTLEGGGFELSLPHDTTASQHRVMLPLPDFPPRKVGANVNRQRRVAAPRVVIQARGR